jgi:hypothetical protein
VSYTIQRSYASEHVLDVALVFLLQRLLLASSIKAELLRHSESMRLGKGWIFPRDLRNPSKGFRYLIHRENVGPRLGMRGLPSACINGGSC